LRAVESSGRGEGHRHRAIATSLVGDDHGTGWSQGRPTEPTSTWVSDACPNGGIAIGATTAVDYPTHPRAAADATLATTTPQAEATATATTTSPATIREEDGVIGGKGAAPDLRRGPTAATAAATATSGRPSPAWRARAPADTGRPGATAATGATGPTSGGCGTVDAITTDAADTDL
jgi:hypothetical protein